MIALPSLLRLTLNHNSSSMISLAEALAVVGAVVAAVATMVQSGTYLVEVLPDQALILSAPAQAQQVKTAAFLEFNLTGIPIYEHVHGATQLADSGLMMNSKQQFVHATHDTRLPGTLIDQDTH